MPLLLVLPPRLVLQPQERSPWRAMPSVICTINPPLSHISCLYSASLSIYLAGCFKSLSNPINHVSTDAIPTDPASLFGALASREECSVGNAVRHLYDYTTFISHLMPLLCSPLNKFSWLLLIITKSYHSRE